MVQNCKAVSTQRVLRQAYTQMFFLRNTETVFTWHSNDRARLFKDDAASQESQGIAHVRIYAGVHSLVRVSIQVLPVLARQLSVGIPHQLRIQTYLTQEWLAALDAGFAAGS